MIIAAWPSQTCPIVDADMLTDAFSVRREAGF
jgi:hypothetical protein